MAWEFRRPMFDLQGTLLVGVAGSDTQIRSTRFQSLPTDFTTGLYLPLTIQDAEKSEVVYVTGHSNASDGVTVARGREGTTPQSFDSTAIVRCTPTLRDVVSAVATRSALPSDAHYGCRVLILSEGQVVERTSAGWNDSAPLEADAGRKHHWLQTAVSTPNSSTLQTVTGLSVANNHTGDIATMAAGKCRLNRAGMWSLAFSGFTTNGYNGSFYLQMTWPGGALPEGDQRGVAQHRVGAAGWMGNQIVLVTWTGYVPAAAAAADITLQAAQMNTNGSAINGQYDFSAEFLGA